MEINKQKIDWSNKTILVVEDDSMNSLFFNELLTPTKAKIIYSTDGEEAVKICKSNPKINIVLMDIKIYSLDGIEATRQIKQFRPSLPVIIQTAHAIEEYRTKSKEAGCDEYIEKPLNIQKLVKLIQKYLK